MANRWEKKIETVTDFIFLGSKITVDGDYSHKILKCLLLGRRAMVNLESILKSRDIALPTKVHMVKAMVFPVVMYDCESWTIKKAEHRRTDAFRFWCWRRLFRVFQFSCSVISDSLRLLTLSTPGLPVHHQLPELTQIRVHHAIQPSQPLSSPSHPVFSHSQHQGLFQ